MCSMGNNEEPLLDGPVFVLPTRLTREATPTAAWITAAGWASGASRRWGHSWLLAPDGPITPEEARRRAAEPHAVGTFSSGWTRRLPTGPVTLAKDVRALLDGWRGRKRALRGPWRTGQVPFVWQRHALFERAGHELASALGCPLVLSVHALHVREASSWGIKRRGWANLVEHLGEGPMLLAADLIAAGSEEIASEIASFGVPGERIVVTPNEVDLDHFSFNVDARAEVRNRYGLSGFVVGWIGSFRSFHGLQAALEAIAELRKYRSDVQLMLVGEGANRPSIEALVQGLNVQEHVIFTGTVAYANMPAYISAMDATLMLSGHSEGFHYSPVKLREYMACSRPVIAHRTGEMARDLVDEETALLVDPDKPTQLAEAVSRIVDTPELAERLGAKAREHTAARGGWERPLATVAEALPTN